MSGVWIAAFATPVILHLGRRFPVARRGWPAAVLLHAGFAVGVTIAQLLLQAIVLSSLHVYPNVMKGPVAAFVVLFMLGFHQSVITYAVLLLMQTGWGYYRGYLERRQEAARLQLRAAELQSQLVGAQLAALKAQLQPHFLFNTLNAIVSLVHQGKNAEAEVMLGRLADLLRSLLEDTHSQQVPLRRELEYLRLYLAIEQVRFADRLRAEVTADEGLLDALVPHLALQPVVENAIRHGLGRSAAASRIAVRARRHGERLVLTVEDDGPGLAPRDPARPPGIGLANTRERLERLYGPDASLAIESIAPHGVRVTLTIPYREPESLSYEDPVAYALHVPDR
jgi:signal transduction histidine kinase